ncbi:MAG TPA: nuclear transport factor 2 family protein [Allosphingosinicella sp.]|nr:nuclear transport factor 2 family protein [Allosphingosinicella sp.]
MDDEHLIRGVIETRIAAMSAKDAPAAVAMLAPDLVAFELTGPLRIAAPQATDASILQSWLDSWEGPVETEIRDLQIHVAGDVAFCHSLNRLRATRRGGHTVDFWMRSTLGLRKRDGEWKIVHGHTSAPFQADGSFRAALDLTP